MNRSAAALRAISVVLSGILLAAALAESADALDVEPPLVLWVWEQPTDSLVQTVIADGFDAVYLHFPPGSTRDPAYETLTRTLRSKAITVYALGGTPDWSQRPDQFEAWLKEVISSSLFDGIVLDVEPYLVPEWSNPKRRVGIMEDYLALLDLASSAGLPVVVTVPFWWDDPRYRISRDAVLIEEVLMRSSAIAIMAYRDHVDGPDGIWGLVDREVAFAARYGKSSIITVQTAPDALPKLTFWEEGRATLLAALRNLSSRWIEGRGFGGLAVHSFRSYVDLPP